MERNLSKNIFSKAKYGLLGIVLSGCASTNFMKVDEPLAVTHNNTLFMYTDASKSLFLEDFSQAKGYDVLLMVQSNGKPQYMIIGNCNKKITETDIIYSFNFRDQLRVSFNDESVKHFTRDPEYTSELRKFEMKDIQEIYDSSKKSLSKELELIKYDF
jgi:hypothetical protein